MGSLDSKDGLELVKTQSAVESLPLHKEVLFVSTVCMAQFMTQVGLSQVLPISYLIGKDFGIDDQPGQLSWFISAYGLTVGTFILIAGRLGDLLGYKPMFVFGFSWLGIWSMVAGLSIYSNHILFNFARAFQGIGPAILLPNSLALLGATYAPGPRKNFCFAMFGATAPSGSIIGAAFGALFGQLAWWPWTFFSYAIACVLLAVVGVYCIPQAPKQFDDGASKLQQFDFLGAATGVAGLVCVNIAWNQAPIVGWSEPYVYMLLIVGILFLVTFFVVEVYFARYPLLPLDALSSDVAFVLGCIACGWSAFGIWLYYLWQFLLEIRELAPLAAAAEFVPCSPSGLAAALATSYLMSRVRPAFVISVSMAAFTVGTIIAMTQPAQQTYWAQTFVSLLVMPWGMDMSFPAASIIISNGVAREHQGIAGSLVSTVVNYSISLGLGFAGTVEVHVNDGGNTKEQMLKGYRGAWYIGCGLAGLGLATSCLFIAKVTMTGLGSKDKQFTDDESGEETAIIDKDLEL